MYVCMQVGHAIPVKNQKCGKKIFSTKEIVIEELVSLKTTAVVANCKYCIIMTMEKYKIRMIYVRVCLYACVYVPHVYALV